MKGLRGMLLSMERTINKCVYLSGENWRKSTFLPVISSLRVTKYDIEKTIEDGLGLVNKLFQIGATLNGSQYKYAVCVLSALDIHQQDNYVPLKSSECDSNDPAQWRFIVQKTPEWFEIRKKAHVTGSTCTAALGLVTLKKQHDHFDSVIHGKNNSMFTSTQGQNMEYGTRYEIHAMATLVSGTACLVSKLEVL
jgi:hypothetical protein